MEAVLVVAESESMDLEAACRDLMLVARAAACTIVRYLPREGEEALVNPEKALVVVAACASSAHTYAELVGSYRGWLLEPC